MEAHMGTKELVKGNEALGYGAIMAGCRFYFGYPITPQNEVPEFMSRELPKIGGTFLQAESEVSAINMVYGVAATGARVMSSTSSTGFSLMQEGISAIAAAELPAVVVNVMREGPGGGGIGPAQLDYLQATKAGGHGGYKAIVLAPASVQETFDLIQQAFYLADKYRMVVLLLSDATIGQMMEPIEMRKFEEGPLPEKDWTVTGNEDKRKSRVLPILLTAADDPSLFQAYHDNLAQKMEIIAQSEVKSEAYSQDDADVLIVAYGSVARISETAIEMAREQGIRAGMVRPISLVPFPYETVGQAVAKAGKTLVAEASMGQLIEDVKLAAAGRGDIHFFGRIGKVISPEEILDNIVKLARG
jgi:2-oxoglutarate ferredoxin oxidoreductase subunit alpha